jgi:hypothetical protein
MTSRANESRTGKTDRRIMMRNLVESTFVTLDGVISSPQSLAEALR